MTVTKFELVEALRTSGEEVIEKLRLLPNEEFERGRFENGWNARQILAHVASIEWTYPRLIEVALRPPSQDGNPPKRETKGGISSYNDRQVAKREGATVDDLLAEFEANRETTLTTVEELDDEMLTKVVTSSGGFTGPLAQVLHWVAVDHVRIHLNDIVGESPK